MKQVSIDINTLMDLVYVKIDKAKHTLAQINNYETHYSKYGNKYFHFIESSYEHMQALLIMLKKEKISKKDAILDAGCGISPALILLRYLSYSNLHGIDINEIYINLLRYYISQSMTYANIRTTLTTGNLLTTNYKDYKVVYSYMPIKDIELFLKYCTQVINTLSPGSLFIETYGPIYELSPKILNKMEKKTIKVNGHLRCPISHSYYIKK